MGLVAAVGGMILTLAGETGLSKAQGPAGGSERETGIQELEALERAVESAFQRADMAYLDGVLADDFQFWTAAGAALPKPQVLKAYAQPGRFPVRRQTAVAIERHGDVALSNGRLEVRSITPREREYIVCYLRLYVRRDGRWQLASHRTFRERDGLTESCAPMESR
jgi:hypothetical protein